MNSGYSHSLLAAPDLFLPTTDDDAINISRSINPRFRGVSISDATGHRSQSSMSTRKEERMPTGHTVVAKRNARERTRVHTVNKAFHILKQRLPSLRIHSKRVSKLRILKAAIIYINNLMDTINAAKESSRGSASSDFHLSLDVPITSSVSTAARNLSASGQTGKSSLDAAALPYIKNFIDYAPYIPQSTNLGLTSNCPPLTGATMPATSLMSSGAMPASSSLVSTDEFASILSTAAATIGYSNPWTAYT